MNSRTTSLIENIEFEVPNTASESKEILFRVSMLKKCSFNLCLKSLSEFGNSSSVAKLFQIIGVG